jgi:hypothetical protein
MSRLPWRRWRPVFQVFRRACPDAHKEGREERPIERFPLPGSFQSPLSPLMGIDHFFR